MMELFWKEGTHLPCSSVFYLTKEKVVLSEIFALGNWNLNLITPLPNWF